jgi:ABC transport system ATP-binding/permease protein
MDFLQAKEDRLALEDAAVQTAKAKYKLELEWMRRQPQARQTKSKSRIEAFYKLQKSTKPRTPDIMLSLESADRRVGSKILSMKHVSLKFDDKVILNDFSYEFCMGDRICIAGGNGVGKVRSMNVTNFVTSSLGFVPSLIS